MKPLSPKQERFVAEYLVDLNATQACIRAGYSPKTADVQGPRLLGNVRIAQAISAGQSKRLAKLNISAERVLGEIASIAFSDIRRWFDAEGRLLPIHQLPDDVAAALGTVEVIREKTIGQDTPIAVLKVKAWDKVRALDMLAKHFGLVKERLEHSGPNGVPLRLASDADLDARIALLESQVKG